MPGPNNKVLVKMLDRLFAALVNGPSLNAKPHNSRQRVDFSYLARLGDTGADDALRRLLGPEREVKLAARVSQPKRRTASNGRRRGVPAATENGDVAVPADGPPLSDAERAAERAWADQQALLGKLRVIADDARTYEQDTGVHVLNVGFPLLSLPPGSFDAGAAGSSRRVLAPIAFVPVAVTLSGGATQNVRVACRADGIDLVTPNNALLAWLEQQTGKPAAADLYVDASGEDPWREICELVTHVCNTLDLDVPEVFKPTPPAPPAAPATAAPEASGPDGATRADPVAPATPVAAIEPDSPPPPAGELNETEIDAELSGKKPQAAAGHDAARADAPDAGPVEPVQPVTPKPAPAAPPARGFNALKLEPAPRADAADDEKARVLPTAILGLFPMANQGLLRDMQAMVAGEALSGPVESFIQVGASFFDEAPKAPAAAGGGAADAPAASAAQGGARPLEPAPVPQRTRAFAEERLVTAGDPFQSRAVKLARESRGLVVHGPPGTGKSQTITNIIGDHLSRGQRVLLVCDKRTALDVVADRLEHMGLGRLCALIHDPQRDQRDLYRDVREQLDALPETRSDEKAGAALAAADAELQKLHAELTDYTTALMRPDPKHGVSLHELMGRWLDAAGVDVIADAAPRAQAGRAAEDDGEPDPAAIAPAPVAARGPLGLAEGTLDSADLHEVESNAGGVRDVLGRARDVDFDRNPWTRAAGVALKDFVARPMESVRLGMAAAVEAARGADAAADPAIPPFPEGADLLVHGQARAELAQQLEAVLRDVPPAVTARWAAGVTDGGQGKALRDARQSVAEAKPFVEAFAAGPLDPALALVVRTPGRMPDHAAIAEQAGSLAQYLETAGKWWSFFAFGRKKQAAAVLARYGLALGADPARRLGVFLTALQARLVLRDLVAELDGPTGAPGAGAAAPLPEDAQLSQSLAAHTAALDLLINVHDDYPLQPLAGRVARALAEPASAPALVGALRKSPARAAALAKLESALRDAKLFDPAWLAAVERKLRAGQTAAGFFANLAARVDTLEGVLRVRQGLADLPKFIRPAAEQLLHQGAPADEGVGVLRREMLATEINRRLRAAPHLQSADGARLRQAFDRYRELDAQKKDLTRDAVLHRWVGRQKERLLAATGSRLNAAGADLKRRLTTRGERAMRLRQVVSVGKGTEGGDPLFDLRPVWMASPETVAQVFPREPIFDVVVFDEASQCRLEEALPVLVRGKRVTIAGDPRQLPPTRFFESAVAASEDDAAEIESDQQLFEMQQGETEDLLGAALGLDIQQCYLDVHYRSRHADLIAFSNEHFYGSRLQPIPCHPRNAPPAAPVTLYPVGGVYEKRENETEADAVVGIVKELLNRRTPPSIGIACFNLSQRDLIVEKLDALAAADPGFAKKLGEARVRRGAGSFEGLFVKNLENVQGDERDHVIISTTYGPDARGKFYRRFGPLGRAGGGRRLNVLVTRAREQVHVVTSIPPEAYRSLPPVPAGQTAGGGWLLFAYLKFAEELGRAYHADADAETDAGSAPAEAGPESALAQSPPAEAGAAVNVRPTKEPSTFARALAHKLSVLHGLGSDVHWGNEGFCVDLALRDGGHVAAGVLCDAARFAGSEDPMEWDVFRTGVLEKQGWTLHRVWTPHFFRDPRGAVKAIAREAGASPSIPPPTVPAPAAVAKPAGRL